MAIVNFLQENYQKSIPYSMNPVSMLNSFNKDVKTSKEIYPNRIGIINSRSAKFFIQIYVLKIKFIE